MTALRNRDFKKKARSLIHINLSGICLKHKWNYPQHPYSKKPSLFSQMGGKYQKIWLIGDKLSRFSAAKNLHYNRNRQLLSQAQG